MRRGWACVFAGVASSLLMVPAAQAGCAQFKVSGTKDCAGLKVEADLSKCEHAHEVGAPSIDCSGEHANVQVKSSGALYQAKAALDPEKWGTRSWALASEVAEVREVAPGASSSTLKSSKSSDGKKSVSSSKGHTVTSSHKPPTVLTSGSVVHSGTPAAAPVLASAEAPKAEAAAASPAPAAPAAPANGLNGLTISGYVDIYYAYNFNNPSSSAPPAPMTANPQSTYHGVDNTQTPYRNFDSRHNTFALNLVELSIKKTVEEMTLKVDFDYGDTADLTHRDANNTVDETSKNIGQAIISWSPKAVPGFTLNVGKMATHMGYETTKAKDNWQYSRSFIFALAIPYWHTGASLVYAPSELISASLFVYNGWNSTTEVNDGKTIGLQLAVTPVSGLTFTYNGISGAERASDDKDKLTVHEGIATWTINPKWSTALDYVNGRYDKAVRDATTGAASAGTWQGATLAVKFAPTAKYYVSPRIEWYWDRDGVTSGTAQTLREATLTNSFILAEGLETRLEVRTDQSNKEPFAKAGKPKKQQATATWGMLASF